MGWEKNMRLSSIFYSFYYLMYFLQTRILEVEKRKIKICRQKKRVLKIQKTGFEDPLKKMKQQVQPDSKSAQSAQNDKKSKKDMRHMAHIYFLQI